MPNILLFILLIILILVISFIIINSFGINFSTTAKYAKKIGGSELVIPANIKILDKKYLTSKNISALGVTSIIFQQRSTLEEDPDNDNTLIIDNSVFKDSQITNLTIPHFIKSIGNFAFANCRNLISITFDERPNWDKHPDESTLEIHNQAFIECTSLSSLTIPSFIISIGNFAFADCRNLLSITFEDRILNGKNIPISDDADADIAHNNKYGDGKESYYTKLDIQENAFADCKKLKQVNNLPTYLEDQSQFRRAINIINKKHNSVNIDTEVPKTSENSKKTVRFSDDITKHIINMDESPTYIRMMAA